jgi:uncharacterized protein involved in response to NO
MLAVALSRGFRPFFLLAALNAAAAMVPWLYVLWGGAVPTQGWPAPTLHAHEMLYGTVVPVIAGFLLTAVPNWTNTTPISGRPLGGLVALWMAGRIALVLAGPVAPLVVAAVDVAFLPVLAAVVGLPIVRSGKLRNFPVVLVLLGLALANAAIHYGLRAPHAAALRTGTTGTVYLVVMLMLIISGRIVPLFTRNALSRSGLDVSVSTPPVVGGLALATALIALALDLAQPRSELAAWLALAAAPLLLARQGFWQPLRVVGEPMLWILHLGHAWLALGFALHGLSALSGQLVGAGALHAFTAGAMGTLILGVMPRVALGHTGRPIVASPATIAMFMLVILGAVLRVAGALSTGPSYRPTVLAGGTLWTSAWLVFCVVYWRTLLGPRVEPA